MTATNSDYPDRETEGACQWIEEFALTALSELEAYLSNAPQNINPSIIRVNKIKENIHYVLSGLRKPGALAPVDKARIANGLATIFEMLFLMTHDVPFAKAFADNTRDRIRAATARHGKMSAEISDLKILELTKEARRNPANKNASPNRIGELIVDEYNKWRNTQADKPVISAKRPKKTEVKAGTLGKRLRKLERVEK